MKNFGEAHGSDSSYPQKFVSKASLGGLADLADGPLKPHCEAKYTEEDRLKPTEPQIFSIFSYFFMIFA